MIKKTFRQLNEIDSVVGELYEKDTTLSQTKFGYAYGKFYEKYVKPVLMELQTELTVISVNNALEDKETKAILMTEDRKEYLYSKEGKIKKMKEQQKLVEEFNEKEFEIEPYVATYKPEMTDEQYEVLKGVIVE